MPQLAGRLHPCLVASALTFVGTVFPASAETGDLEPWEIEAVYKNDVFDRCTLGRALDNDISVTFIRTDRALSLLLSSPFWQLDTGKDYPVTIKLGPQSWNRDVEAKVNSVSMTIDGAKVLSGLRAANALDIVAAGATIRVPLDGSTAAFERLDRCVARAGSVGATPADKDPQMEAEAEPGGKPAEEAGRSTAAQVPPPPPAKPEIGQDGLKEEPAASSAAGPPPPTAKPEVEAKAEDARAEDASADASAVEDPAAAPAEDARAEDASAEDAVLTSEEESPAPPAAKPEKPPAQAAKKASPAKKRNSSSAQSAKRAFQREIDRLRRFFGN